MNYSILILIFSLLFSSDQYKLIKSVPVKEPQFFTSDNLGNSYIIKNNILYKHELQSDKTYNYSEKNLGKIGWIDATDAFKLLVLYPDFNIVKVLDTKLAPKAMIDLRQINILQPRLVCSSYNDCIWLYDQQDFRLKRINPALQQVNETPNIHQLLNINLQPNYLVENNKWLYINDPENGIIVFDFFGTYYKTIAIKGLKSFQVAGDEIIYFSNNDLKATFTRYNIKTQISKEILLPASNKDSIIDVRIAQGKMFLFKKEVIDLYSF